MERGKGNLLTGFFLRKNPALAASVRRRPEVYNESIAFLRNPPDGVSVIEVNPPEDFRTKRLTKDPAVLEADYQKGFEAGMALIERWEKE